MALYANNTRFDAIVTLRITAAQNPQDVLKVGIESAMKPLGFKLGIHDVLVGSGEFIDLSEGASAEFLFVRNTP